MAFSHSQNDEESRKLSWMQTMGSGVAAAFGVQSRKNRERDFASGDVKKFVVAGLTVTALLLFSLMGLVKWVLA